MSVTWWLYPGIHETPRMRPDHFAVKPNPEDGEVDNVDLEVSEERDIQAGERTAVSIETYA